MVNQHQPIVSDKKARVGWGVLEVSKPTTVVVVCNIGVKFGLEAMRGGDGCFKEKPNLGEKALKELRKDFRYRLV